MPGYNKTETAILKQFGAVVRIKRDELGLSQEELGEIVNLHRTYIGGIEQGRRNLSLLNIIKLSKALGMEPENIFEQMKTIKLTKKTKKEPVLNK